ncbi:MAG: hypothetical protein KVP17_000646 [Porospora cf. gigantea B]|uniref:uncharacterized protein n=1 Tax=Porospora cf. gigantea B TaxID=2853592 RepID=UPI003571B3EB|nr:MAG: hypothetical protein KVP17_000646 [Porospora cf. gigantea B]
MFLAFMILMKFESLLLFVGVYASTVPSTAGVGVTPSDLSILGVGGANYGQEAFKRLAGVLQDLLPELDLIQDPADVPGYPSELTKETQLYLANPTPFLVRSLSAFRLVRACFHNLTVPIEVKNLLDAVADVDASIISISDAKLSNHPLPQDQIQFLHTYTRFASWFFAGLREIRVGGAPSEVALFQQFWNHASLLMSDGATLGPERLSGRAGKLLADAPKVLKQISSPESTKVTSSVITIVLLSAFGLFVFVLLMCVCWRH